MCRLFGVAVAALPRARRWALALILSLTFWVLVLVLVLASALSALRYSATRTGNAQGRTAKGNWTRIVRTTHLCPQR